jgi:hypothetical protein
VPFIGGDLSPQEAGPFGCAVDLECLAHYFGLARHRTDVRDCTNFEGRNMLPLVEFDDGGSGEQGKEGKA